MIEGKVARILNARELVINRGLEHGVTQDMKFSVLERTGEDIKDPDTGEILGSVSRTKVNVRVVDVRPRMSVARTYEMIGGRSGLLGPDLSRLFSEVAARPQTLKTDEATWQPITEAESFVKTGDPVRQLIPEDRAS